MRAKEKLKKLLAIMLTVTLVLSLLSVGVYAEEETDATNTINYECLYTTKAVSDGVEITGLNATYIDMLGTDTDGHIHIALVIPATINGTAVVGIGESAFSTGNSVGLPKQSLPDSLRITSIDLSGATNLTTIGNNAFYYGGDGTFYYDELSSGLVFPKNGKLTSIGKCAFYGQGKLTGDLTFPDTVETIGAQAFQSAGFDGTLTLPDNGKFTEVASQAFIHTKIKDIAGLTTAGKLPPNLQTLGKYAFSDTAIEGDIVLPDTITTLWNAFQDTNITSLYVPSSVTSIHPHFVRGCNQLEWAMLDFDFQGAQSFVSESSGLTFLEGINNTAVIIMNNKASYDNAHTTNITANSKLNQLTYPVTLTFNGLDENYNVEVLYNQPINLQKTDADRKAYETNTEYKLPDQPTGSSVYNVWSFEKSGGSSVTETSLVTGDTLYSVQVSPKLTVTYSGNIEGTYGTPKVFTATASINAPYELKPYSDGLQDGDYYVVYRWYTFGTDKGYQYFYDENKCAYNYTGSRSFTNVSESRAGFGSDSVYRVYVLETDLYRVGEEAEVDYAIQSFTVNITPATPTVNLTPSRVPVGTAVKDIDFALADNSTPGTLTITTASDQEIVEGEQSITYNFTPDDPENYTTVTNASATITGYNIYTVTFDKNDGSQVETQTVNGGNPVARPDDPTREGYTFNGWTLNDAAYDFSTPVSDNITLTAQWTQISTTTPTTPTISTTATGNSAGSGNDSTDIVDEDVPLASAVGLNSDDHFAYILGYADGSVRPNANITRAEVATIFFRLMTDDYRAANWSTENSFSDVASDKWYNNAISTAAMAGILNGYTDGTFQPNQSITRAEFAAIAARFLSSEVEDNGVARFSDISGHWAEDSINRAVAAGWINGYTDGTFRPDQPITRAEVVSVINSMLDRIPTEDGLLDDMITFTDNLPGTWYYTAIQEAANAHDYDRDDLGISEFWTAILPARDWTELEKQWATAYAGQTTEDAEAADTAEEEETTEDQTGTE